MSLSLSAVDTNLERLFISTWNRNQPASCQALTGWTTLSCTVRQWKYKKLLYKTPLIGGKNWLRNYETLHSCLTETNECCGPECIAVVNALLQKDTNGGERRWTTHRGFYFTVRNATVMLVSAGINRRPSLAYDTYMCTVNSLSFLLEHFLPLKENYFKLPQNTTCSNITKISASQILMVTVNCNLITLMLYKQCTCPWKWLCDRD